jgi:hypothetical protein
MELSYKSFSKNFCGFLSNIEFDLDFFVGMLKNFMSQIFEGVMKKNELFVAFQPNFSVFMKLQKRFRIRKKISWKK